ncbi:MAG: 3-isopropylmalate dehydratase small subunit [Chloroflexota bacterium]|nr:3-isopropylmalate dehydratase small subunit [Chloroflexota bacterium]
MTLSGRVFVFERDVDTDQIIPAQFCHSVDEELLRAHVFEYYRPDFRAVVRPGDMIFAGENFGCGSSREHAPLALKAIGVAAVVAPSFARIFYRNALNIGLPILVCPEAAAAARDGGLARVDPASGNVEVDGRVFRAEPFPEFLQQIIAKGGLLNYLQDRLRPR